MTTTYDLFIAHSGTDKAGFVERLADDLRRAGVRVWYDDYVVTWGDSISRRIAEGLARSRFGIVVLSPGFIAGGWTRHELQGLWQLVVHGSGRILPILHEISHEEVRAFDPALADVRAMDTSRHELEQIVAAAVALLRGGAEPAAAAPVLDVHRLSDLAALSERQVLERLERYARAVRVSPGSGEVVLGLGAIHLHLRRFAEAAERLDEAARLLPTSASAHLYRAAAIVRGRNPRSLSLAEARQVLDALALSASLAPGDGLPDLLALVVKHEYFRMNGLRVPPPDPDHHLRALGEKRVDERELAALRAVLPGGGLLDALAR